MRKTISVFFGIAVLGGAAAASCRAADPAAQQKLVPGNSGFRIVLAETGEALFTERDIAYYEWGRQRVHLNKRGILKWNSHIVYNESADPPFPIMGGLYMKEFVVMLNGKELYRGKFWNMASSRSYDGLVITDTLFSLGKRYGEEILDFISIECGYPGPTRDLLPKCSKRNPPELFDYLKARGLLKISGGDEASPEERPVGDAYDFPLKPGTPEWKAIISHDERVSACQVPENILKKMSTSGLVETVLSYPHFGDMLAYNTIEQGFAKMSTRFNGFPELYKRKDAGTVLLARYRAMDPAAAGKNFNILNIMFIEILLAQQPILSVLTETQREELYKEANAKYKTKQKYPSRYGGLSMGLTALLAKKSLQK